MDKKRVLIAPVGEQPTPNLIPLFAAKDDERYEFVQFMVSDTPRIKEVAEHLRVAIKDDEALKDVIVAAPDLTMNAWDLIKAREECEAAISRYIHQGHSVTVNLTGGTKIMSLAAYQAAANTRSAMIYVNTEQRELIHFNEQGQPTSAKSFKAPISIKTQLHSAGRKFKRYSRKPLLHPSDIKDDQADFARYLVDRYAVVYANLIRPVLDLASAGGGQPWGRSVLFSPKGQSVEAAQRTQELELWKWDQKAGTITIINKEAFEFLKGGWVETFVLKTLADDRRFDEVLGNVEIEDLQNKPFEGELDIIVTRNGRLGIIECKTTGPRGDEGKTFAVAKIRLHEVIFGGPYAKAVFALPSNENINQWKAISEQYKLPEPIYGGNLKQLAKTMHELLGP